jgi:hypothetical protein
MKKEHDTKLNSMTNTLTSATQKIEKGSNQ